MYLAGFVLFIVIYIGSCIGILMQASLIGDLKEAKVFACILPLLMPLSIIYASIHEKDAEILKLFFHMDALAVVVLKDFCELAIKRKYEKPKQPIITVKWEVPILESIDTLQERLAH